MFDSFYMKLILPRTLDPYTFHLIKVVVKM